MAISVFNPPVAASPGTQQSVELSLNKSSFGDGYTQASPKGLNHMRKVLALKWEVLTPDQAKQLETFFVAQAGYKPFWYTHPTDGVKRKWTCEEWASGFGVPATFSATLRENFTTAT